ncbi:MAG: endolytic transglycosylase MltG [Cyanobacteria bacterium P01_A01_bin.45]
MKVWRKSRLFILGTLPLAVGISIWQSWSWWNWAISPVQTGKNSSANVQELKSLQLEIPNGTAAQQIGTNLQKSGLIRSKLAWNLWTKYLTWQNPEGGFKAGTYELSPSLSLKEIADRVWKGKVIQSTYTIPEGWSLQQMAKYFQSKDFFSSEEFLAATVEINRSKYPWLPEDINSLEGFLYPDTYEIPNGTITPQEIVQQMLKQFQIVALPVYKSQTNSTPLNLSLKDWVTFASIVEKEAVIPKERPLISGVFTSRLQKGMKLESDPTVEYALGIRQTADKPLTFNQVKVQSPYNTYANPGLPPAPIANPGLESLKATLTPQATDYLFFVARYDGTHVFSRTLQDHQKAVVQIRRQRNLKSQNQ